MEVIGVGKKDVTIDELQRVNRSMSSLLDWIVMVESELKAVEKVLQRLNDPDRLNQMRLGLGHVVHLHAGQNAMMEELDGGKADAFARDANGTQIRVGDRVLGAGLSSQVTHPGACSREVMGMSGFPDYTDLVFEDGTGVKACEVRLWRRITRRIDS